MHKLRILLTFCTLALLLTAASPLVCWKIGWDLRVHRARCWSTEFDGKQVAEPTIAPTATPLAYPTETPVPEPTATETWEWHPTATFVYPYPMPTLLTLEPYPMPTSEPYPGPEVWGGIKPDSGWWK
jgi:hypothetical protein